MIFGEFPRAGRIAAALVLVAALAACDTAEERAEDHYQSALSLMDKGDTDRALVELRNVFKLNGQHREARALYAATVRDLGEEVEALQQFRLLIEQYPDEVPAHLAVAEIAIKYNDWDMAGTHIESLETIAPDDPDVRALQTVAAYRAAVTQGEAKARREIAASAADLSATVPENTLLRTVVIDSHLLDEDYDAALSEIEIAQGFDPQNGRLFQMRMLALGRLNDAEGLEATLLQMINAFPEETSLPGTLIRLYTANGRMDEAETFLRSRVIPQVANDAARTDLVMFLAASRGQEATLEQVGRFIEEGTNDDYFRTLLATLKFESGEQDAAISELEAILQDAAPGEQTNRIRTALARMLAAQGNAVGARAQIETVLEQDPSMVDALLMRAQWQIQSDQTDQAILDLRRALDQDPDNADVLTLMAQAHMRNGDSDLAGETLSIATEVSNRAPAQSLRYARFLTSEGRFLPAESVLIDALRLAPNTPELMSELGAVHVRMEDWPRAAQVETSLRALETPAGIAAADSLRVAMLQAQQKDSDAIAFLEDLTAREGDSLTSSVGIVRAHLAKQDFAAAQSHVEALKQKFPGNPNVAFLAAAVATATGDFEAAEQGYRAILSQYPEAERAWIELVRLLAAAGQPAEARIALTQGLEAAPKNADLLWFKATLHEQAHEFDAAIEIYDDLYARNTGNSILANNLASLLATAREDEESLARAYQISRRLRDSEVPAYQDTYGWIAYRRGDFDAALPNLESAATGLPKDALVQYHLAKVYQAQNMPQKALAQYEKALEIAGNDPRAAFEDAREQIKMLHSQ